LPPKRKRDKIFLEFSFTQEERDNVLKYCSLKADLVRRFRKIVPAGSDIIVVFDKPEANEMMNSLSRTTYHASGDTALKGIFEDLHYRFSERYNDVFTK
jgi:hypothetical protein